jgi:hypothetical protein
MNKIFMKTETAVLLKSDNTSQLFWLYKDNNNGRIRHKTAMHI